ncbi:MAG: universal stress protein [Pseudomonadota bacterium]
MDRILIASDLSIRSERPLRRAFKLAERDGAELTIAHIVDEDLPEEMARRMLEEGGAELGRLAASISAHPHTIRVEVGDPLTRLHEIADEIDADLLVLGRHRPRPLADMFGGTTLERLVRGGRRPILLVVDAVDHAYERPVCGLDASPACVAAAEMAAALAPGARISTFHSVHVPFRGYLAPHGSPEEIAPFLEAARREMAAWLAEAGLPEACDPPVLTATGLSGALSAAMARSKADLLAVGAHGRWTLSLSSLGGFTEGLLRDPPCDMVVVRR